MGDDPEIGEDVFGKDDVGNLARNLAIAYHKNSTVGIGELVAYMNNITGFQQAGLRFSMIGNPNDFVNAAYRILNSPDPLERHLYLIPIVVTSYDDGGGSVGP